MAGTAERLEEPLLADADPTPPHNASKSGYRKLMDRRPRRIVRGSQNQKDIRTDRELTWPSFSSSSSGMLSRLFGLDQLLLRLREDREEWCSKNSSLS